MTKSSGTVLIIKQRSENSAAGRASRKVCDVMTPRPITVGPDASLDKAAALMIANRISGLPVINAAGVVVGIITAGDLIRRVELGTARPPPGWLSSFVLPSHAAQSYFYAHGRKVREVMTNEVITISPEAAIEEVMETMESHQLKRLPVLENGQLVGIVSCADLLRVPTSVLPRAERGDHL